MAPPPILPTYQRAPHQKPLRRIEERQVGRQEPDREVITHINDADSGYLPLDMHNYIPDRKEMHLPGHSFTDFDGASSRKFLNKKKEEKGGWATVKSLPHMPEMVNFRVNCKIFRFMFFSTAGLPSSRVVLLSCSHAILPCTIPGFANRINFHLTVYQYLDPAGNDGLRNTTRRGGMSSDFPFDSPSMM